MSNLDFKIINSVRSPIDNHPNYIHHATLIRRDKMYVVLRDKLTQKITIEHLEKNVVNFNCLYIEDDNEWQDAYDFCLNAGLLTISKNKEFIVGPSIVL